MNEQYQSLRAYFEGELTKVFSELRDIPEPLFSAMKYSLFAGGKRIRPVLCLAFAELFGAKEDALPFALALEMIHTYSLIHDDLPCMDDDDLRRGRPTCHKVYGEGMATLAGDALLNLAFETLLSADLKKANSRKAAWIIANCAGGSGMVAGQCADLEGEKTDSCTEEEIAYIHLNKTAKLMMAAGISGALAGGADSRSVRSVENFCRDLGLAFQIQDDILDVEGTVEELGKCVKHDAKKKTCVKAIGLAASKEKAQTYLDEAADEILKLNRNVDFFLDLLKNLTGRKK